MKPDIFNSDVTPQSIISSSSPSSSSTSPSSTNPPDLPVYSFTVNCPKPTHYIIPASSHQSLISSAGELYSDVIESYMASHSKKTSDLFLFPFVSVTDIAFHGESTLRKTNKLSNYKFLAGPVFKADSKHWTLLFVDVKKKHFIILIHYTHVNKIHFLLMFLIIFVISVQVLVTYVRLNGLMDLYPKT